VEATNRAYVFADSVDTFKRAAAAQALAMGSFQRAGHNPTHPEPTNFLAGDATVLTSRFNAAPGATYVDPETGEIITKRSDPDASYYTVLDEFGNAKRDKVYGTKFGILHTRQPYEAEQIITDIFHITTGQNREALAVERAVQDFHRLVPSLAGLVYDMAIRGVNREHFYDLGLHTITKCPQLRKGQPRSRSLGAVDARKGSDDVQTVEVWAINGSPHMSTIVDGRREHVRLERVRTQIVKNKRSRKKDCRAYRWYGHYEIPRDDARVPTRLRGARVVLRLDDPDCQRAPYSRADNLHSIAPGEADWERLFDLRNPTESINWWIKSRLQGRRSRAPAVGAARQHFWLIGVALYNNYQALVAHAQRTETAAA